MILTPLQTFIIILMASLSSIITRFLPFALFKRSSSRSQYVSYLGQVLPYAAIGMLVVYCLKDIPSASASYAVSQIISIISIVILHIWKGNALLSIGAGTAIHMFLVQTILA